MNASDPARRNNLTDEQLDALLDQAGQEVLHYIQARTDPAATLNQLMTGPPGRNPATPTRRPPDWAPRIAPPSPGASCPADGSGAP
jgi:hypothetical protein